MGDCACHLSVCVSFPLSIPQADDLLVPVFFLQCDPVFQKPIRYDMAVSSEVLKHVYVAKRLQPPTSLSHMLGA